MDDFSYRFPRCNKYMNCSIVGQQQKIAGEIDECIAAENIEDAVMEALDVLHATETLLRMYEERYRVNVAEISREVEVKNRTRGYYRVATNG